MTMRWLLILWCLSCASSPSVELAVDLRSDYLPGVDLDRIEVFVDVGRLGRSEQTLLLGTESLLSGHRVAEFIDLPRGTYRVRLVAHRGSAEVATRNVDVELRDSLAMTVVVSRSCEGVVCPQDGGPEIATECIGGSCEPPACLPERPSSCLGACSSDSQCPSLGCGAGRCVETACFVEADDGACASRECRPDLSCAPIDASMADAFDAGDPDAGFDSGPPLPTCPARARDCPDEFDDWERTGGWSCRADEKLGRAPFTVTCRVCNTAGCRDCDYGGIVVECRCQEPETCSSGRCTSGVSNSRSRCDDGSTEFQCPETTNPEC